MLGAPAFRHPLIPNAYYLGEDDGTVRVTMGSRWGRFDATGRYLEGTLFEADPDDKTGETQAGRRLIREMEEILRPGWQDRERLA